MARHRKSRISNKVDLADIVSDILEDYADGVTDTIAPTIKEVSEETVETLKTSGDYGDRTGEYRKSFAYTMEKTFRGARSYVHNTGQEYRKAHLLEHGHVNRDGTTRTKAHPHWKPAQQQAATAFLRKMRQNIKEVE